MKTQKLVLFDIDGTLLDQKTDMKIPESAKDAVRRLQKAGHIAMVNTGRCASFMEDCVREAGFDGFIYGCGTNVVFHGEELFHQSLPEEVTKRLVKMVRQCKIDAILEGKKASYFDYNGIIHGEEFRRISGKETYIRSSYEDPDMVVDKLYLCTYPESGFEAFRNEFSKIFSFIDRGKGFYELVPEGISKATGIQRMMEYLSIPVEQTYSIGDSTNDLPMLTFTGTSIAMGNSMEEILPYVTHKTKNIEDDGIAYAIDEIILGHSD